MKVCVFGNDETLHPVSFHLWGIIFSLSGQFFKVSGGGKVMYKEHSLNAIDNRILEGLAHLWVNS